MKLETPKGVIEGHDLCAEYLEDDVKKLLLTDAGVLPAAQTRLLEEVIPCFTEADNAAFLATPTI